MLPLPSSGPRPPHPPPPRQFPHPHHPPASHPPPREGTVTASSSRVVSPDTVTPPPPPPPPPSWRHFGPPPPSSVPHDDFHGRLRRSNEHFPPWHPVAPSAEHQTQPQQPRESYDPSRWGRCGFGFHEEEDGRWERDQYRDHDDAARWGWERRRHRSRRRDSYSTAWRGDGRGRGDGCDGSDSNGGGGGLDLGRGRDDGSPAGDVKAEEAMSADGGDRSDRDREEERPDQDRRASGFASAVDNIIAAAKAIDQRERVPSPSVAAASAVASAPENTEERTSNHDGSTGDESKETAPNRNRTPLPSPPITTPSVRSIHHAQIAATPSDGRLSTGHPRGYRYRSAAHPPPPYHVPPRHHPGHGHYHPPPPPHHPYYAYPRRYAHSHAHARIPPPPHASHLSPRHHCRPPPHTGGAPPHEAYDYYSPDLRREYPPHPRRSHPFPPPIPRPPTHRADDPSSPHPRPCHDPRYGPARLPEPHHRFGEFPRSASPPTGNRPPPATEEVSPFAVRDDDGGRTETKRPRVAPSRSFSSSRPADATPPGRRGDETTPRAPPAARPTLERNALSRPRASSDRRTERVDPAVERAMISPGTLRKEIVRAVLAARRIESDPSLYRAILLRMALERESKDSPKKPMMLACAEKQTAGKKSSVIYEGFFWKDYPPLENILRRFMEEYYEMSENRPQSKKQQQFNNRLVSIVHHTATTHGWTFDPDAYGGSEKNIHSPESLPGSCGDFNYKKLRDRIRCYYKTHVQNSKKRLITLLKNPKKAKNREMLLRLVREVCGDEDSPMGRSEEYEIPSSSSLDAEASASTRVHVGAVTPSNATFAPNVKDIPAKVLFPSLTSSSFQSTPLPGEVSSSPSSSSGESPRNECDNATIHAQVSPQTTIIEHSAVLNPMQEEAV